MSTDITSLLWHSATIGILLRTLPVLLGTLGLLTLLRKNSASVRHLVCACSVVFLLLLPFLAFVPVRWNLPVLPQAKSPIVMKPSPLPVSSKTQKDADAGGRDTARVLGFTKAEQTEANFIDSTIFLKIILPVVYGIGVVFVFVPFLIGLAQAAWLTRKGKVVSVKIEAELLPEIVRQLGLKRIPLIRCTHEKAILSPMTYGWHKPVILLPHNAESWPTRRLYAALLHECAHIVRRDWTIKRACNHHYADS